MPEIKDILPSQGSKGSYGPGGGSEESKGNPTPNDWTAPNEEVAMARLQCIDLLASSTKLKAILKDAFKLYVAEGYTPVALRLASKDACAPWPISEQDFASLVDEGRAGGIGVICGRPSQGLLGLDFDSSREYVHFLDGFPQWAKSRTVRTHRGFQVHLRANTLDSDVPTIYGGGSDGSGGGELDVLGEGHVAVMPPSIHPSGSLYTFDRYVDPVIVNVKYVLMRLFRAGLVTSDQ